MMEELMTRTRDSKGNCHEKPGLKRLSYRCLVTIPDWAGTSPNPAWNFMNTRSSQPYQGSLTPDFSYPLISSTSFLSSFPISLFLVLNSIITRKQKVRSALSISPCCVQVLTPSTWYTEYSIHHVQHTPSTAHTEVQHTPSTASTQDCLSSLYSHDDELTPGCRLRFWHASLQYWPPSACC